MQAAGPVVDPLPCSGCGKLLDPLRAGHVAIFDNRLHYFCDVASCRASFLAPFGKVSEPSPSPRATLDRVSLRLEEARTSASEQRSNIGNAHAAVIPEDDLPDPLKLDDDRSLVEPIERSIVSHAPAGGESAEPRDVGALLLLLGVVAGTLAVLLGMASSGRLVLLARVVLAGVGASMLVARALTTPRNPSDPHPLPLLAGPVAAVAIAAWAVLRSSPALASEAVSLAGAIATVSAVGTWLLETARRSVENERAWMEAALDVGARRLPPDGGPPEEGVLDVRVGERILVEEGEDVPVDMIVSEGEAEVLPWLGAATPVRRRVGEPIVAGAHLWKGRVVGTCTWSGMDRVFARLALDPRRRLDALVPVAQAARSLVERWAAVTAIASGTLSYVITRNAVDAAMTAVAVQAGLATSIVGSLGGISVSRGLMSAQRRGVTYKSADAWNRASHVSVALFCARGTLLLGEPEVAEVEALSQTLETLDVLRLSAGAARAESSPTAQAILRAAKARGIKPDAVRNPTVTVGLGVVAVTSSGEELCVGSRAHLLNQRVGVASAEWRMGELEALGRSVVLVALGGRLVGIVALQDGIRPGARAAVQHLLDAHVEPVLMSGDSRETCDAIARSLDIEHVRAEILPADRADEVKRIVDSGESVAVLGHAQIDDPALSAGDVSVALAAAGTASSEHDIALASDDLRDAALSLALARRTRVEARVGFALAAMPPALGVLVVALGVLPPAFVPIAAFLGGVVGVFHGRAAERARPST